MALNEADDILGAVTDEGAAVTGVFEQRPDDFNSGVAEFYAEDHVGVETLHEFRQRCIGAEDVPEVDDQSGGRMAGRSDQLGALGHRADQTERKRFDRDAGADRRCFVGDPAERFDERCDVVDGGSECGSDFDERSMKSLGRFEQQFPGSAPGQVVPPPAGSEFDLDVLQAGGLDLGP